MTPTDPPPPPPKVAKPTRLEQSSIEDTGEIELPKRPSLLEEMRDCPGSLLLYAAEWAGIVLLVIGILSLVFVLCVGGYELVQRVS